MTFLAHILRAVRDWILRVIRLFMAGRSMLWDSGPWLGYCPLPAVRLPKNSFLRRSGRG